MVTKQLETELTRCLAAVKVYQKSYEHLAGQPKNEYTGLDAYLFPNPTHAAAIRASMDLTKMLSKWRQTSTGNWTQPK